MTSSFSINYPLIPTINPLEVKIKKALKWCRDIYYHHSDALSSLSILTLNTTVLAGKIFQNFPQILGRAANTLLSYVGIISLNMQIRDLTKKGDDCLLAIQAKEWEKLVFCAAKVTIAALNVLLTCGTFSATLVALFWSPAIALSMYLAMRPFSLFSFALGIAVDLADYEINNHLNHKMSEVLNLNKCDRKIQTVMNDFLSLLHKKKGVGLGSMALHIFRQQEHYTLEKLNEQFGEWLSADEAKKLFLSLKQTLRNKQFFTKANFGLLALGYVCMGICRLYPETVVQSLTLWSISLLYTGKMLYQKSTLTGCDK